MAFDINRDEFTNNYFSSMRRGNFQLEGHFGEPLTQMINVIIYGQFNGLIKIDAARNVLL